MRKEVIRLPEAIVEVEDHEGFLFIREQGRLRDRRDLQRYLDQLERIIARTGATRAVIDAREEQDDATPEVRETMWAWLTDAERSFKKVAFVLPTEMAVARVNMTALSRNAEIRAFDSLFAAQRWLLSSQRRSTASRMTAPEAEPSSPRLNPPPRSRPDGGYHVTEAREERVGGSRPGRPAPRSGAAPRATSSRPPETRSGTAPRPGGARRSEDDGSEGAA